MKKLMLHQELCLLSLDDSSGTFAGSMFEYGFAGAMLSELILQNRVKVSDDDKSPVEVIDMTRIKDDLLNELLEMIQSSNKPRSAKHWVSKAANIKDLKHRIAEQLCDLGVLKQDEKKVLWLFSKRIYPELECYYEDGLRKDMASVMFDEAVKPDPQTAVLIAFASQIGVLKSNFAQVELKQFAERIKGIAEGKILASEATASAIAAVRTAINVAVMVPIITASIAN